MGVPTGGGHIGTALKVDSTKHTPVTWLVFSPYKGASDFVSDSTTNRKYKLSKPGFAAIVTL